MAGSALALGGIMRTFWKLGGAGLALICGSAAQAADMPLKAPPVAAAPFSWVGFYVGANVGGIQDVGQVRNATLALEPNGFTDVTGAFTGFPGILVFIPGTFPMPVSYSRTGGRSAIGGGQFGYNWQTGHAVFGLEADVDAMRTSEIFTGTFSQTFTGLAPGSALTRSLTGNINVVRDWQATLRGRLGYAGDRWLVYGTGGVSATSIQPQATFTAVTTLSPGLAPIAGLPNANGTTTNTSSQTLWGYTVGAGLEHALTNAIVLGAEYRFTHYGTRTLALGTSPAGFIPVFTPPTGSFSLDTHQVTLRLSYLFGH